MTIPVELNDDEEKRINWYMQLESKCMFFCRVRDGVYILDGIQGININETIFMEIFNEVVSVQNYALR